MNLFYTPDILTQGVLPEEESQHCVRVLRLEAGASLWLTDGRGSFYEAVITLPHPKRCGIEIVAQRNVEKPWKGSIRVAVAPTKNMDRMEWFAEKSTEIGIDSISLVRCAHSERKEVRADRLRKIQISAMKQSHQAWLPALEEMTDFARVISQPFSGDRFIAYCGAEFEKRLLKEEMRADVDTMVLIGPEGDFSPQEVEQALSAGFRPVSLGETRLRTETAALVACHTFQLIQ